MIDRQSCGSASLDQWLCLHVYNPDQSLLQPAKSGGIILHYWISCYFEWHMCACVWPHCHEAAACQHHTRPVTVGPSYDLAIGMCLFLSGSESLPFLVITIGFGRHIKYTKSILSNTNNNNDNSVFMMLAWDCFTEITIFCLGAKSGISGLREFCWLSACLLAFDFVLLCTWYTAILALKLEVIGLVFHTFGRGCFVCVMMIYIVLFLAESIQYGRRDQAPAKQLQQRICLALDPGKDEAVHGKVQARLDGGFTR